MEKRVEIQEKFKNPDRRYAIYPIVHGGVAAVPGFAEDLKQRGLQESLAT